MRSLTYRALALLLSYPIDATRALFPEVVAVLEADERLPTAVRRALGKLAQETASIDICEAQGRYVRLFEQTRSLSLNLRDYRRGEGADRGRVAVGLVELYRSHGPGLSASEAPGDLLVLLEFLSTLRADQAASLLGEFSHMLSVLDRRLAMRQSSYRAVFAALSALAAGCSDDEGLARLMAEAHDNPDDEEALDKLTAEDAVGLGPSDVSGPKAKARITAQGPLPFLYGSA